MIAPAAWTGVRPVPSFVMCDECGRVMPAHENAPQDDCPHAVVHVITGSRTERLAQLLRLTYGDRDGAPRRMNARRNDWIADAEELLKVAGVV